VSVPPDRKKLDSRRVGAVLVDGLVFLPITLMSWQYEWGIQALASAFWLIYFFVSDCTTGQTLGKVLFKLRTVTLDGGIVSGRAAAARTVLRLIDHTVVGLIVMVCTGKRRQRLGDLAAKTAVVDARDVVVTRTFEPSMLLYPAAWLVPAVIACTLTVMGRFPGSYRVTADAVCAQTEQELLPQIRTAADIVAFGYEEAARLRALDAPPHWRDRHDMLVAEYEQYAARAERVVRRVQRSGSGRQAWVKASARLQGHAAKANARLAALGYEDCAGTGAPS
jgi:hypothetical protein